VVRYIYAMAGEDVLNESRLTSQYLYVWQLRRYLEVVSDLSTDAFLNAFKRFISRRGRPANVYSDNGTNFVGANRELEKCEKLFYSEQLRRHIMDHVVSEEIKWHFK